MKAPTHARTHARTCRDVTLVMFEAGRDSVQLQPHCARHVRRLVVPAGEADHRVHVSAHGEPVPVRRHLRNVHRTIKGACSGNASLGISTPAGLALRAPAPACTGNASLGMGTLAGLARSATPPACSGDVSLGMGTLAGLALRATAAPACSGNVGLGMGTLAGHWRYAQQLLPVQATLMLASVPLAKLALHPTAPANPSRDSVPLAAAPPEFEPTKKT